jgi:hypothetical protein
MAELHLTVADLAKEISLPTGERHRIVLVGAYVGLELVDEEGNPVPEVTYRVSQGKSVVRTGVLDDEGKAKVTGFLPGPCEISFPELDAVEWLPDAEVPMSGSTHQVEKDEHVAAIAAQYGFHSFTTIWDHPKNAEIRQLHENPHVLKPGDTVFIPDHSKSKATRATGDLYQFTLKSDPIKLRIKLLSFIGDPLDGAACTLTVDGAETNLKSDADGFVEMVIPPATRAATLTTDDQQYELIVGGLDPIDTPSGLQARMRNLGYDLDAGDEENRVDPDQLRFAIELFQYDQELPITGEADEQTKLAIQKVAGA